MKNKKTALIILDGLALGDLNFKGNAYAQAKAPTLNKIFTDNSVALLKTDGAVVGLPSFQVGGSEVGHMTIGSGRSTKHVLTKINDDIESGAFFKNKILQNLFEKAQKNGRIHFCGLASDGGIHSFLPHLFGLQAMAKKYEIKEVFIHAMIDGRDVPVRTAKVYLEQIEQQKVGSIASFGGRFFGMDRDQNWERTEHEYKVLTDDSVLASSRSWKEILDDFYKSSEDSDYYVPPVLLDKKGQIQAEDVVICFNYRTDRMKQLSAVLCDTEFEHFKRSVVVSAEKMGVFGNYYSRAKTVYSLSGEALKNTLGSVLSQQNKTQIRVAETEKSKHVTFFFSGEQDEMFKGEERIIVRSSGVPNYATDPEMSAAEHTDKLIERIENGSSIDFILQNFANPDIVGHSGNLQSAIEAVETVDNQLKRLLPVLKAHGYDVLVTADHGNCDIMQYPDGSPHVSHTKNLVPAIIIKANGELVPLREKGALADIAPTILGLMSLSVPKEMTGTDLRIV